MTAGLQFSPDNSRLTEADDTLRITLRNTKAAFGTNSPDACALHPITRKVKRCRLRGLTQ